VAAEAAAAAAAAAVVAVAVAVAGTVGTLATLNLRRQLRGRVVVPVETVLFVPINTPPVCLPQSLVSV
jgi:ABC-type spermidine/putrescine transport system permease subunit II